jgi:multimeric flavodoxin WrbA
MQNKDKKCSIATDYVNEVIAGMIEADGIILGSPTYFTDVSAEMKGLIDRSGMVARANDNMLRLKVGAAVVAARRAGSVHCFDTINHFFFINEMIVPGSTYWNVGFGRNKGEVEKDEEGIATMKNLGKNMAWLLKKITV